MSDPFGPPGGYTPQGDPYPFAEYTPQGDPVWFETNGRGDVIAPGHTQSTARGDSYVGAFTERGDRIPDMRYPVPNVSEAEIAHAVETAPRTDPHSTIYPLPTYPPSITAPSMTSSAAVQGPAAKTSTAAGRHQSSPPTRIRTRGERLAEAARRMVTWLVAAATILSVAGAAMWAISDRGPYGDAARSDMRERFSLLTSPEWDCASIRGSRPLYPNVHTVTCRSTTGPDGRVRILRFRDEATQRAHQDARSGRVDGPVNWLLNETVVGQRTRETRDTQGRRQVVIERFYEDGAPWAIEVRAATTRKAIRLAKLAFAGCPKWTTPDGLIIGQPEVPALIC